MESLYVIKIGGNIIDDPSLLTSFLQKFAGIKSKKILVHGGGKLATRVAEQMGIPQTMSEGRRITDAETLKIVTMVYAGYINKHVVAELQSVHCNAAGFTGAGAGAPLAVATAARALTAESLISRMALSSACSRFSGDTSR